MQRGEGESAFLLQSEAGNETLELVVIFETVFGEDTDASKLPPPFSGDLL